MALHSSAGRPSQLFKNLNSKIALIPMMLVALVGYLASVALLVPLFDNHGLWIALNVFLALRGLLLLARLKRKTDHTFADSQ